MKKLLYLGVVLVGLIAAVVLHGIDADKNVWVHQHRQDTSLNYIHAENNNTEFSSHLPVVSIDTKGQQVPGEQREKDMITTDLKVFDKKHSRNNLSQEPAISTKAQLKYRGNSSLHFDKKSYLIKFISEDGTKNKEEVMGMPEHSEWVLNGPFLDKTLMRNYFCMNISGEIMGYAPRVRYCELFVDNEYRGVYLMMESITVGEQRIPIKETEIGDRLSGYILRVDRGDEMINELNNFTKYSKRILPDTDRNTYWLDVNYPPKSKLTPNLKEYIEQDFSSFEKTLYSYSYRSKTYGYPNYINIDSFVDFFIISEFFQNYDAGIYSTYFHKDLKDKIHIGPVWDFNNACDNYMETAHDGTGFMMHNRTWYSMLIKDKAFTDAVISRYGSLRKTVLKEEYLLTYIDEVRQYLSDAADRNYEVWGYTFDPTSLTESGMLMPIERNVRSYDEAIDQLKNFIVFRGNWMDQNIDLLRQYSHKSRVKKFNH